MGFDPVSMAVAAVVSAGASAVARNSAKKAAAKSQAALASQQPKVVPLPDEGDEVVRRRVAGARDSLRNRRGYASTLITGQLGDTRAPQVSAPLILGG